MGHDVVTNFFLALLRYIVIDLILMGLQLIDLFLRNRQPQFHLGPGQSDPKPPPSGKFFVRRKDVYKRQAIESLPFAVFFLMNQFAHIADRRRPAQRPISVGNQVFAGVDPPLDWRESRTPPKWPGR